MSRKDLLDCSTDGAKWADDLQCAASVTMVPNDLIY